MKKQLILSFFLLSSIQIIFASQQYDNQKLPTINARYQTQEMLEKQRSGLNSPLQRHYKMTDVKSLETKYIDELNNKSSFDTYVLDPTIVEVEHYGYEPNFKDGKKVKGTRTRRLSFDGKMKPYTVNDRVSLDPIEKASSISDKTDSDTTFETQTSLLAAITLHQRDVSKNLRPTVLRSENPSVDSLNLLAPTPSDLTDNSNPTSYTNSPAPPTPPIEGNNSGRVSKFKNSFPSSSSTPNDDYFNEASL